MPERNPAVGKWFVTDAPVTDSKHDAFGHDDIAANLHRMLVEHSTHRRMIGLFGGFGVGKSTIVALLKNKLNGHNDLRLVRMSAERHEPAGFHRAAVYAFAESLVHEGLLKRTNASDVLEQLRNTQTTSFSDLSLSPVGRAFRALQETVKNSRTGFIVVALSAILLAGIILSIGAAVIPEDFWSKISLFITTLVTGSALFAPFLWLGSKIQVGQFNLGTLLTPGTTVIQRAKVEAADEQEMAFAELVELVDQRLVIAIDDIDRLSPSQVLDALNAIRSFQLTCKPEKRPIFIVSIDERIVEEAIRSDSHDESKTQASEYLNRLFTLRQTVPVHEVFDLRDFAHAALETQAPELLKHMGERRDGILSILIHDDVADPRHVIRLLNAFSSDLRLALAREDRLGARSLQPGSVSSDQETLARMVVIKNDYSWFFDLMLIDLNILDSASRASEIEVTDEDNFILEEAGLSISNPGQASLFKFLARTRAWVSPEADQLPYIYLGQDRFSRTLGSADARDLRSALSNNQPLKLAEIYERATTSGESELLHFRELLRASIRELDGLEQLNGIAAILSAVADGKNVVNQELADAVAMAVGEKNTWISNVTGSLQVLGLISPHLRKRFAETILQATTTEDESLVWRNREVVIGAIGEAAAMEWASSRIASIENWEAFESWAQTDLSSDLTSALLDQSLGLAVHESSQTDAEALSVVSELAASAHGQNKISDWENLRKTLRLSPHTYEVAVALVVANASTLTEKSISEMVLDFEKGQDQLPDGEKVLMPVREEFLGHAIRVAKCAPDWELPGKPRRRCALVAAEIVGSWLNDGDLPISRSVDLFTALLDADITDVSSLTEPIFDAWLEEPAGSDTDDVYIQISAEHVLDRIPEASAEVQADIKRKWLEVLSSEDHRSTAVDAVLRDSLDLPEDWLDEAIGQLSGEIQVNSNFTEASIHPIAKLIAAKTPSAPVISQLQRQLQAVSQYGGINLQRVLKSVALISWPEGHLSSTLDLFANYVTAFDDSDFWSLIDQQISTGKLSPGFVSVLDDLASSDPSNGEILKRGAALASQLTSANATAVAAVAADTKVMQAVANRLVAGDEDPTPSEVLSILQRVSEHAESQSAKEAFARVLGDENIDIYTDTVFMLVDETLDVGNEEQGLLWKFASIPIGSAALEKVWRQALQGLTGSAEEAIRASKILTATGSDARFDKLVAANISTVMTRWVTELSDPTVSGSIGKCLAPGSESASQALAGWKRPPRNLERLEAYKAAKGALSA